MCYGRAMGQVQLVLAFWFAIVHTAFSVDDSRIEDGHYQTKYDNMNIDDVFNHPKLVHHYVLCLVDKGPCPYETGDLKPIFPEILETNCLYCTDRQVYILLTVIRRLRADYPPLWKEMTIVYDPNNIYFKSFEEKHGSKFPVKEKPK